ncbi:hypothetical protein ABW20_dc0109240 [Dactylellina cionopaga]|nr:hypothetical protein ABW20_dc0109240 [Dactylellina cionopaga]
MQPPLRIAILETDSPNADFQSKYGSYGDAFVRLLSNASMTLNPPLGPNDLQFTKWDVERNPDYYPDLEEVDALLIGGSHFTRKVLMEQDRVRVIGVNFGQLVIGRALGCVVDRMPQGYETSITTIELSDMGKKIYGRNDLNIMQHHRDHIVTLPVNPFPQLPNAVLEITGYADICAVQGLYTPGKVISLQGHPELARETMSALVQDRLRQGYFSKDMANDAITRTSLRNDGVHIAATFLKFLLEP